MKPLVALCAGLVVCGGQVAMAAAPKPDILFLMPDQMRGDCLSLLGHPAVRTPNLERLASEGREGAYGFYEAIDLSRERSREGERSEDWR